MAVSTQRGASACLDLRRGPAGQSAAGGGVRSPQGSCSPAKTASPQLPQRRTMPPLQRPPYARHTRGAEDMASKDDDDAAAQAFGAVVAMLIIATVVVISFSVVNSVKIYNRLKDPDHPKHDELKFIFGIPVAMIGLGLLVSTGDPDAGGALILWTIIGYWLATMYLVLSPDALGPAIAPSALRLENYLFPFDQEPPEDRSVFPKQTYALTGSEKLEQALTGLSTPPRGPERDRARAWEANIRALQQAFKSD